MVELLVTSFPFALRVFYLRWRGIPVTLYNTRHALFLWAVLALCVFFVAFYYHPKSYTGVVPFRTVPVSPEIGGTVVEVPVENGDRVEPGQVLFRLDDQRQQAAVRVARTALDEVDGAVAAAEAQRATAMARVHSAEAALRQAEASLADQETLRTNQSTAFRENEFTRLTNVLAERQANLEAAQAGLHEVEVQIETVLPTQREAAQAALEQAEVELDKTTIRSQVAGTLSQVTLLPGARAGVAALRPVMLIVPDRGEDRPPFVVAGFNQVARSVLYVGMPAEVACDNNFNPSTRNAILPARIAMIQDAVASGQVGPTGRLIEPSELAVPGEVVVDLALVYPEQEALLTDGGTCMVQTYSVGHAGGLGGGAGPHVVQTLGVLKAFLLRTKFWFALATGAGLGGGGH